MLIWEHIIHSQNHTTDTHITVFTNEINDELIADRYYAKDPVSEEVPACPFVKLGQNLLLAILLAPALDCSPCSFSGETCESLENLVDWLRPGSSILSLSHRSHEDSWALAAMDRSVFHIQNRNANDSQAPDDQLDQEMVSAWPVTGSPTSSSQTTRCHSYKMTYSGRNN